MLSALALASGEQGSAGVPVARESGERGVPPVALALAGYERVSPRQALTLVRGERNVPQAGECGSARVELSLTPTHTRMQKRW